MFGEFFTDYYLQLYTSSFYAKMYPIVLPKNEITHCEYFMFSVVFGAVRN